MFRSGTEEGIERVRATVTRIEDRVLLPVEVHGPAVVTLVSGTRTVVPTAVPKPSSSPCLRFLRPARSTAVAPG